MPKTNIFFISVDSLRADEFYGPSKGSLTPNFDKLIKQGVYFDQTISSGDATFVSWIGMFTGKHPFKVRNRSSKLQKLNKNVETYFDILKKEGYHFYSFLPPSAKALGLFPKFENDECYTEIPKFSDTFDKKIKNFLSSHKKEPWMCFVHTFNLHFPVRTPNGFEDEQFGINNYEKQISSIDNSIGKLIELIDLNNTLVILSADHGAYFQTVQLDDRKLNYETKGNLQHLAIKVTSKVPKSLHSTKTKLFLTLEKIKKKKRLKDIHNLNLKPHQLRGLLHQRSNTDKFLYDDLVHVPLLLLGSGINGGKIISQQVRLIDLFPTICDLLRIKNPIDIDGKSIIPLIDGKRLEELPAYFESSPMIQIKSNDVIGIRTSKYKYFRDQHDKKKRRFLFDLEKDPYEDNNIINNEKSVDAMEKVLNEITYGGSLLSNTYTTNESDKIDETLSENIEDELKKMGYV